MHDWLMLVVLLLDSLMHCVICMLFIDVICQREPTPDQEVKVDIPEELRKWLVDDWDFVTRQKQVSNMKYIYTLRSLLLAGT